MTSIHFNKIYRYFIEIKHKPYEVDSSLAAYELFDIAEEQNKFIRVDRNIRLALFKTEYEKSPAALILFIIEFDGKISISILNDIVLGLIEYLEKSFGKLDDVSFMKEQDKRNKKNVSFLKIIKKLKEEDLN